MATENIGTKYNTQIPSLTENADIQTALKIYHYGQSTEPTNLVADSVAGHLKNLEDTKVDIVPIQILAGGENNLNLKITTGYYSVATNAIASAGSNYPSSATAGMLQVINDGSGIIYQTYITNLAKLYWRGYYSGAWTSWTQASDTSHSHPEFASLAGDIATKQAIITGAASSVTSANLANSAALVSDASGKIAASSTVSATELGYLDGVTSAIQTQLNAKAPLASPALTGTATAVNLTVSGTATLSGGVTATGITITGTNSTLDLSGTGTATLPASTSIGNVSSTEIGYLDGVTSAIQTQFTNAATNLSNGLATKPTQLLGNKSAGVAVPAGTKRIVIARDNGSGAPDATITPAEGDIWFW